jgi:hypothetical protein
VHKAKKTQSNNNETLHFPISPWYIDPFVSPSIDL